MTTVFQFSSSATLEQLTGRKAFNLDDLLGIVKTCSDSSIFYHTFSAFLKMRQAQIPFNSDFAIWVAQQLNEAGLAERLRAVDLTEQVTIQSLRSNLIQIIEAYKEEKPKSFSKTADEPFYLYDVMRMVYLTDKFAYDLASLSDVLKGISIYSIYFHFIESRLYARRRTDDLSIWIETELNLPALAKRIRRIDITVYTIEGLRSKLVEVINAHLSGQTTAISG
jgi:Family of unknown function (DUF5752)